MDYAILKTGSKQYRVKPGDVIDVEKLPVEEGSAVELTDVLAVSRDGEMLVGDPLVPDASVLALVQSQGRDRKIYSVQVQAENVRYRRKKGHRQPYTRLAIMAIVSWAMRRSASRSHRRTRSQPPRSSRRRIG